MYVFIRLPLLIIIYIYEKVGAYFMFSSSNNFLSIKNVTPAGWNSEYLPFLV